MAKKYPGEETRGADQALLDNLQRMGFTLPEARTYAALARVQPATAYEVAKVSGLARANSYNAVSNLVLKGAIQPVSSQPVRYAVSAAHHFFPAMADEMARTSQEVVRQVEALSVPLTSDFVDVSEGQFAMEENVRALIGQARENLYMKASDALAAPFREELQAALARGVRVRIVATGADWDHLARKGAHVIPHEGTGSAPSPANETMLTVVADAKAGFVGSTAPVYRGYAAQNPTLVYLMLTMILHEIYLAEIVGAIGLDRLAEAAVDFATLRRLFRPPEHGSRLAVSP